MSVREAAILLKKSEVTIRRLINDDFLKAVKIGKGGRTSHYRIYKESLDELVRKSKGGL
ncbi:helix-turn-helix domain-containing protein [Candidatus Uabimicrobium sp. HlEnr_7]|uniref:helix-turn-helix domain-containing protein n=1 Tax=Candidatus Uabimicrobium helgolandensis TaxID=3095367 RepID=UPI003557BDD9